MAGPQHYSFTQPLQSFGCFFSVRASRDGKPKFSLDNTGPVHIIDIVKSFDSKSSPHLDGLSLKFIKSVISEINVPLAHIFNLSFDQGIFPEKLKDCRIVPSLNQVTPNYMTTIDQFLL